MFQNSKTSAKFQVSRFITILTCLSIFTMYSTIQQKNKEREYQMQARFFQQEEFHREKKNLFENVTEETLKSGNCPIHWESEYFKDTDSSYYTNFNGQTVIKTPNTFQEANWVTPKYQMNPEKFLFPTLLNGPNNQLLALRESMMMALGLNRTLVIPFFMKHRTDGRLRRSIHPSHRVDVDKMCSLISCITFGEFQQKCDRKLDVFFQMRSYLPAQLYLAQKFAKSFGFQNTFASRQAKEIFDGIENLPRNMKEISTDRSKIIIRQKDQFKNLYDSEGRCAMAQDVFNNIVFPNNEIHKEPIYGEVIKSTPFPQHIRSIAQHFIRDVIKHKFIAVHWRYDLNDFRQGCKVGSGSSSERQVICKKSAKYNSANVAEVVSKTLSDISVIDEDVKTVFLSSPPSEMKFVQKVQTELLQKGLRVFNHNDVVSFVNKHYSSCDFIKEHVNDITSSVEQEVCTQCQAFIKSQGSSWSGNVYRWRLIHQTNHYKLDRNVLL